MKAALCAAGLGYLTLITLHDPPNYSKIHQGMTRQELVSVRGQAWGYMPGSLLDRHTGLIYLEHEGLLHDGATVDLGPDDLVEEVHVTREPRLFRQALKRVGL
jgi:hypothetical protein